MTEIVFYTSAFIAVFCTFMTVTNLNPVHALLYLITSLLSLAIIFFTLGAPFAALLEVIVYAGAIMVLFVFVVMMLNLGDAAVQEHHIFNRKVWAGPSVLALVLLLELFVLLGKGPLTSIGSEVTAKQVGIALYGPYLLGVELASMLLLGALVAAYHLGRQE